MTSAHSVPNSIKTFLTLVGDASKHSPAFVKNLSKISCDIDALTLYWCVEPFLCYQKQSMARRNVLLKQFVIWTTIVLRMPGCEELLRNPQIATMCDRIKGRTTFVN